MSTGRFLLGNDCLFSPAKRIPVDGINHPSIRLSPGVAQSLVTIQGEWELANVIIVRILGQKMIRFLYALDSEVAEPSDRFERVFAVWQGFAVEPKYPHGITDLGHDSPGGLYSLSSSSHEQSEVGYAISGCV
jgi:hypothetical protein